MEHIILSSPTHYTPDERKQSQHKANESARQRLASFSSTPGLDLSWGRRQHYGSSLQALGCACIMTLCPLLVIFYWVALSSFRGSLTAAWCAMWTMGPIRFCLVHAPQGDFNVHLCYVGWLLFQAGLYQFLPGRASVGQLTPAGNISASVV